MERLAWDCMALTVKEAKYNASARILAFKRPDGKITLFLSNRSKAKERGFDPAIAGGEKMVWKGFLYTPEEAGAGTLGMEVGTLRVSGFKPVLLPMS